jgi:2-phospho-L-lactate/phosphoenolpyruvate guanylyltransferase
METWEHVVVVPVKPPARGKSRLVGPGEDERRDLAAAFALDTVAACLATPRVAQVLAVTDDAAFATRLVALGCAVVPDGVAGDLNGSLRQAVAEARRRWPGLRPVALCADLPSLRPDDLGRALATLPPDAPAFVADATGTGTTMYAAPHGEFDPRFGPGSRDAHLASGAVEVPGALATLRQDVDDLDDLGRAEELGLGPRTRAVLTSSSAP